jgi:hypothetical protein
MRCCSRAAAIDVWKKESCCCPKDIFILAVFEYLRDLTETDTG